MSDKSHSGHEKGMVKYTHRKKNGGKLMKALIIGGVAGGASCAARLRRLNEKAEIVILERGEFISFANCGLPYYIGVRSPRSQISLCKHPRASRLVSISKFAHSARRLP